MDEKVAYPVVVIGPITTVAKELVAFFKKDPSCEIMHVESFETARAHIQQFPHCIVVGSIEAKEQLGATLGLLKALNLKTTRDRVKVLLVGKSNFAYLSEVMRALFVADYIIEPAAAKTVAFKARLQLNTLKIAVASGTAKKEEKSRTFNKALPTEGEKDQDSFRFKGKKAAPANEKFLIEDAAGVNAPSDGSNAVVSNDLDGSKLAQKADHTAEGETANAPEWKQNIVGEERSKDPAYEKAKNSLYEKARTAAAAAKILKSDSPAPTLKNAEIKAAQSPEEKNPEEVLVSKDEAAPAALSLLKKLSSENGKASAPNQKSSLGATAKAGQKPSFSEAGSGEAEAKAEWNSKTGGASETNLDELASTEFKDSEAPERKSGHGSNADKTALTPGVRTSDVKNLSPQEKEKIRAAAKKESERVEKERQAKSLQPSAANTGRAENELSHLGSANAKDAENVAEESDSEDSVAAKVAKLEKLKGEEVPEEKVVSEQLRSVFQRLAAKSDLKKKELEKSRVEAAEVVRVAQLHKKERQVAQAKEVQAESQRTRDLAHARTEAKRKAAPADNESEDLELPLSSRKKRKIESEEESEKKKRQEHQSEELLDEPEFNELESKEEQALDSGFEPDSFSPDITENTSSVFGHGGGEAAGTKINASDSDVSDPEVMWRAQKAALATLKKITWFYRTKTEISMLPGSWIQTDDGYYFLRKKIAADGIRIIQEALPLWIYRGKFAPDIHQDNLRWRFRETEPVRIVSSSELPAAILANVSKYLFEEGSVSKGLSSQAKSFKDSFENSLSADSFDANSSEESGPDNGGLLADELAETDAGAGAKISNASDAEGEDIFGRKELRKKAKAEAAAEAEAAALVASDKKSKNSELDAELDAELEDAFHDSLEESIAEEEEHHDSAGLDLKAKKAKREADDSLAEGSLDQKKARKNTELENAEEGFEKEELSSESDLQGSDSEAQSSNAEEEISASDRAQESETEKDIEDIFSAAAKAKSRRGTKDISAQESEEESEKERNADSALTHLAESVSAEVDSESADQAQVRKKKRRGIFAALKEKLAPKQSLEAKEEKAAKRREDEEAAIAKRLRGKNPAPVSEEDLTQESPLSAADKKKLLGDTGDDANSKEKMPGSISAIVPSQFLDGANEVSANMAKPVAEGAGDSSPVAATPSAFDPVSDSERGAEFTPNLKIALVPTPAPMLAEEPEKPRGEQALPLASMLGQAFASKQQLPFTGDSANKGSSVSRLGNNNGLSLAQAMAKALNEGRKRRGSDLSLVSEPAGNRLATSLALAQIGKNKMGKMAIFRVINEFCSSHLPMIKIRYVEYRDGNFFYKDSQFNDEKRVGSWDLAQQIRQQGAALREINSADGSLLILCETHAPMRPIRENEFRLINQIGNSYTVNVIEVQSEKQIVA